MRPHAAAATTDAGHVRIACICSELHGGLHKFAAQYFTYERLRILATILHRRYANASPLGVLDFFVIGAAAKVRRYYSCTTCCSVSMVREVARACPSEPLPLLRLLHTALACCCLLSVCKGGCNGGHVPVADSTIAGVQDGEEHGDVRGGRDPGTRCLWDLVGSPVIALPRPICAFARSSSGC